MPTALITGAFRGARPRAGRRPWPSAAGRSSLDARDADRLAAAVAGLTGATIGRRRRRHRPAAPRGAGPRPSPAPARLDLLVNNASTLGPQPAAAARRPRAPRPSTTSWRDQRRGAARADPALLPALRGSRRRRRRHLLGRRRRALRGLGRLRREQGRARPPRRLTSPPRTRPAVLRRRPGRHAHRDAPGGLPGRGHQRPAAAGDRRPRAAAAARARAPPSGRYRAADFAARRRCV